MTPGSQVGVGVCAGARLLVVVACLAALPACEPKMAETAVFVEVFRLDPAPVPDRLLVTWLDAREVLLRDQAVPASGSLNPAREPLAVVAFEIEMPGADLERRVLLLGMRGDQVVCRGHERVTVQPRAWVTRPVALTAEMPADGDNDGMPDAIDNCMGSSDFTGCPATPQAP
jgi:hypothetical protein